MTEDNHLIADRKAKIATWNEQGFAAYAEKFDRTHTAEQALADIEKSSIREAKVIMDSQPTKEIRLCGRIVNQREMGKLAFLRLRDGTGDFQICLAKNALGEQFKTYLKMLDLGDFCGFSGEFFVTNHGEPTLMAAEVFPLAKSIRPLPEKWAGLKDTEECYRHRHLDLISNADTVKRFKIRSAVVKEIREFLHEKDFMEVETRTLQPQAGGAMAKVFETHHNALDHEFVLRISLELELKILVAGGLERVFEMGKCFRNEGTDPSHLQEFTLLEWYAAYQNLETNMSWTQEMLQRICNNVLGTTKITVLDKDEKPVEIDFSADFPKVRFPDLLKEYAKVDMATISREELIDLCTKEYEMDAEEAAKTSRGNLLDHVYKKTARPHLIQPTFVMDYPSDVKPLARPNDDGTADCYQLLIAGWEVVNSYGELVDPQVQRRLLEEQADAKAAGDDEAMEVDEDFLGAMEVGMPPMTGFGMGIDRIVALLTTQPNLRDVVLFPLLKPKNQTPPPSRRGLGGGSQENPHPTPLPPRRREGIEKSADFSSTSDEKIDAGITREQAHEILKKYADFALQRHCVHVAQAMGALAHHFEASDEADTWYIAGLLHDLDWNHTIENPEEHCGQMLEDILTEHGVNPALLEVIRSHYPFKGIPLDTKMKQALFACDELSGFTVAAALMRPTKMIGITPKSVTKKMKDKKFAEAVSREDMKSCEEFFDLPVAEFLSILIPAFEAIAHEWELAEE